MSQHTAVVTSAQIRPDWMANSRRRRGGKRSATPAAFLLLLGLLLAPSLKPVEAISLVTSNSFCVSDVLPVAGVCIGPTVVGADHAMSSQSRLFAGPGMNWGANSAMSINRSSFAAAAFSGGFLEHSSPFMSTAEFRSISTGNVYDRVMLPGSAGATGTMSFLWEVTGVVDAGFTNGGANASLSIGCNAFIGGSPADCPDSIFMFDAGRTVFDEIVPVVVPVAFNASTDFQIAVTLAANTYAIGMDGIASSAFANADFSRTGVLKGVIVRDANGAVIANPTIISESGFDYAGVGQVVAAAPEPSTILLAGVGLIGLLAQRARHRCWGNHVSFSVTGAVISPGLAYSRT